jgi:PAS domain S-box-containing protein
MNFQSSSDDLVNKLTKVPFKKKLAKTGHPSTYADDLKLLHELQLQQLEMEMQNQELRANQFTLEELNKKHVELFEFAPNGYFSLSEDGMVREVNFTGANLLGIKKDKIVNQLFLNFIPSEDQETFAICWFNLIETQDYQVFKTRLSRHDGHQLYVRIALSINERSNGFQILLALTDVTLVRQIENAQTFLLTGSWSTSGKDFFRALAEYLSKNLRMDCVSIDKFMNNNLEAQSLAVYGDGHFADNVSYPIRESAIGNCLGQKSFCFSNEVRKRFPGDARLQKAHAESYAGVTLWGSDAKPIGMIMVMGRQPMLDARLTEMVLKQVSIRAAAELEHRQLEEAIIHSRDQLELLVKERTAELEESNQQLRQLTHRMDAIAEEERTRIAREIHDELGHLLTAMKYDIDNLINASPLSMKLVKSELGTMMGMMDSLIDSVRKIATDLRPGILDHLGLFPAIEWQIRQFRMRTKICCVFTMDEMDVTFDQNETTIIYRIFQEILTNITRHSHARHVQVLLTKKSDYFELKVIDNGVGFEPGGNNRSNALGLMGMQERALSIGGELCIESKPGKGTTITFLLPGVKVKISRTEIYI